MIASNHYLSDYPAGLIAQVWPNAALPLNLKGRGALITLAPSSVQPLTATHLGTVRAVEFSQCNAVFGRNAVLAAIGEMSATGSAVLQFQTDADAIAYAGRFFPNATTQGSV
jgi:hypothetical protein